MCLQRNVSTMRNYRVSSGEEDGGERVSLKLRLHKSELSSPWWITLNISMASVNLLHRPLWAAAALWFFSGPYWRLAEPQVLGTVTDTILEQGGAPSCCAWGVTSLESILLGLDLGPTNVGFPFPEKPFSNSVFLLQLIINNEGKADIVFSFYNS